MKSKLTKEADFNALIQKTNLYIPTMPSEMWE